jgi:hypothetical protein
LPTRVSRLEMKQYGKVSTGDMCDRLDKLDEIVKPASLAPKGYVSDEVQVDPDSGKPIIQTAAGTSAGGPSPSLGSYPRVTELERQFLGGQTHADEDLTARLGRLETKRFNKTFPDDALVDRIDRLDKGAQHTGALAEDHALDGSGGNSGGNGNGSGSKPSLGSMIGKALLGLAGINSGPGGMGMSMGGGGLGLGGPGGGIMPGLSMGGMGMPGIPGAAGGPGSVNAAGRGKARRSADADPTPAPQPPENPFAPGSMEIRGTESRTTILEKFVFGKESPKKPIEQRVAVLEKKLVPYEHDNASKDLGKRVDHLWSILQAANTQPSAKKTGVDQ